MSLLRPQGPVMAAAVQHASLHTTTIRLSSPFTAGLGLRSLSSISRASSSPSYAFFGQTRLFSQSCPRPLSIRQHAVRSRLPSVHRSSILLMSRRQFHLPRLPPLIPERFKWLGFFARFLVSTAIGLVAIGCAILLHDSMTYREGHVDRVPINGLALHPRVGGPKHLPIVERNLGDEEDDETKALQEKPHLVIVGGGWGAVALLKKLPTQEYNITLVAPDNFNLFTPLLPSACVGTVEPRTLVEPLRKILARVRGHYISGSAVDVDFSQRLLEVEVGKDEHGDKQRCYVPYDKLVIAVGATTNTHGVPGLEHCFQLKTIPDAQAIRRQIMTNLELSSLPTTDPEERKRLLSFVVCGGGPTGVEFAAELADMMSEDVLAFFPKLLKSQVSIKLVQSRDHILNQYSEEISQFAEKRFDRQDIEVIKNARVKEVFPDHVIVTCKDSKAKDAPVTERSIPCGFVLWSTGIAMNPFVRRLVNKLPNQVHSKAIVVDDQLRVKGAPLGTVYAVGDAATISTHLTDYVFDLFDKVDTDKDNKINFAQWQEMTRYIKKYFPLAGQQFNKVRELFDHYDSDKDNEISLNECVTAFDELGKKATSLPATAQVAAQQGAYLGQKFNALARQRKGLIANELPDQPDETYSKPFNYFHLGSLAYVGNSAVFDMNGHSFTGGLIAMYAWRSVYWSEQTSHRTQILLMIDWIKRGIFGRDLSKF